MKQTKTFLLLHFLMLLFSFMPIFSKMAGQHPFFSFQFFLYYGIVLLILGIYAILWQQVIKRIPLTTAYANKAVTVVWGMLWGILIFKEHIGLQKCIGAVIIIAGVILYALSERKEPRPNV